jgi:hypothetical protein
MINEITPIIKKRGRKPKVKEAKTTTPIIVIKEVQYINF